MERVTASEDDLKSIPPVSTILPEILSTIFLDIQPKRRSKYRIPFEVAMSHVCSHWRNTALTTPLLWSSIDIYSPRSFDYVSSYLQRSQQCPVDLRIDIWQSDRVLDIQAGATTIIPLIDLITQHSNRWRTLVVFASHRTTTNAILSRMKDLAAPLLEGVRIVNDKADVDPDDFEPPNQAFALTPRVLTGGAPNLVAVHSNNLDNLPPLVNATTLHLGTNNFFSSFEFNTQILTNLAAACPFLSTLSIHGRYVGTLDVAGVAMPSLRFLWFESGNTDTLVATFLTKVEMPNLESLWLDCPHNEVINTVRNHHPRPYFPALKYLTLQRFDYFSSSKFAQVFPTIEALHLSFCSGYHVSFLTGALVQDDLSHWQSLRTLVFRTTSERHIKKLSESINQIVTKRESGGRPVQRVLLDRDLLAALSTEKSVRAFTSLEELRADNYDDPWWIVSHTDTRDRL